MSVPSEEREALKLAWTFLFDLLDPKKTRKVPMEIRKRASRILRHYPGPQAVELFYKREL